MEGIPDRQPIASLSPGEVDKIAAGEVVERPLNVVKELVENALDAGATEISIELEDGGRQLVRVSDNGGGIPAAELALALKPHHTSKIRSLDDIYRLSTMGFRGEALASIAAVSRLALTSRHSGESAGARIECDGGVAGEVRPANYQQGTEVEVRELFYNTPVRIKFLRSKQSESAMAGRIVTSYALAYPEVAWQLNSSGRELLSTSGSGSLRDVVAELLGGTLARALQPVHFEFPPLAVSGLVSPPEFFLRNRARQWYFVNRRPVVNKLLYKATDDAVREFVSPGKHPAAIILLDLPPEEIDVNVHPMKTEVSFSQPQAVYSLLSTALRRALGEAGRARQQQLTRGLSNVVRPVAETQGKRQTTSTDARSDIERLKRQREIPVFEEGLPIVVERGGVRREPEDHALPQPLEFPEAAEAPAAAQPAGEPPDSGPDLRIEQVGGSFLVATTADAVYLVDQHEAHERILFETLYADLRQTAAAGRSQALLFELTVELAAAERETAQDYITDLRRAGFRAELREGALAISAVPAVLRGTLDAPLVHGMLEDLRDSGSSTVLEERYKNIASVIACRSAVKGHAALTPAERRDLVLRLLDSDSSLSCPHGSPTVIRLGEDELRRMFRR